MASRRTSHMKTSPKRLVNKVQQSPNEPLVEERPIVDDKKQSPNARPFPCPFLLALRASFFLFFFCFWFFRYGNFLFMSQEYDLFLWDLNYLQEGASRVAGLSRCLSSFIVQFFYIPFLGALILSSMALFLQYATEKLFNLERWGLAFSFLPPCLLALPITNVNFFLFECFDVAYLFSFTFNYAFSLTFVLLFESIRLQRKRILFFIVSFIITFPVFGFFTLLGAIFCLMKEYARCFKESKITPSKRLGNVSSPSSIPSEKISKKPFSPRELLELLFLFVLLTPGFFWFVYSQSTPYFHYLYTAGLWEESTLTQGRELSTNVFFSLYQILTPLSLLTLAIIDCIRTCRPSRVRPSVKSSKTETRPRFCQYVTTTLIFVFCLGVYVLSFSSSNFQTLLEVARALDNENWEKIIKEESKVVNPINPLITARVLALTRTNRLPNELFKRPLTPKVSPQLVTVQTFGMCGDRMLYEYGATNLAMRTAMNDFVTKRDRSAWALKTLTLCALANERYDVVQRYVFYLQKTMFHRSFADMVLNYVQTHSSENVYSIYLRSPSPTPPEKMEQFERRLNEVRAQFPFEDDLSSSGTVDHIRYRMVQTDNISKRSLSEQENLLTTLLLMRNYPRFCEFFDSYLEKKGKEPAPRYLQEAILFRQRFSKLFDPEQESWTPPNETPIDPNIRKRFERFLTILNPNESNETLDRKLGREFGDTFWFFVGAATQHENY